MRVIASTVTQISQPQKLFEGLFSLGPVSQSLSILFSILQTEGISIAVYDVEDRLVKTVFGGQLVQGIHQITWNLNSSVVADGVYFLRFSGNNFSKTSKLIVQR